MNNSERKRYKISDSLSYVPCYLSMCFDETEIAVGTAFFYMYEEQSYLVTNWHNVTGLNPDTLTCISKIGALPNCLHLKIPHKIQDESGTLYLYWQPHRLALYAETSEYLKTPVWYEHPQHRHKVDVVAIPLNQTVTGIEGTEIRAANASTHNLSKIMLSPGLDVFVLGFPVGMSGGGRFPIWKRGSIASEPDFDIDGLPKIYIDTATREGMSGSPVYAQRVGFWFPEDASEPISYNEAVIGEGRRFLGIYSGRVGDDSFNAQLGIVWKASAVDEIIRSAVTGKSPLEIMQCS
jgi:hypothetical protein